MSIASAPSQHFPPRIALAPQTVRSASVSDSRGSVSDSPCLRLIMMRHAEALEDFSGRDFDRPLQDEGRSHSARVADEIASLSDKGWLPELILSSNALVCIF